MSLWFCIEALDVAYHDRKSFDCGVPVLNEYLQRHAGQHARSNLSRTFGAAHDRCVPGYYSFAVGAIQKANLKPEDQRRFPHLPLPVMRLARLAVGLSEQGRGIGQDLLVDALARTHRMAREAGIIGLVVDAKSEQAAAFYER